MSNSGCGGCDEITLPLGQDGVDGKNAFTRTTSSFLQPAANQNVTINVSNIGQFSNSWASVGQIIYISNLSGNGGWYSVVSIAGTESIEIKNLNYPGSTAENLPINSPANVSPSGSTGAAGVRGDDGDNGLVGTPGLNGTTLLKSATGIGNALDTYNNLATPLLFTANQLCAQNGDKAVVEVSITNDAGSSRGIAGEVKVLLDGNPSTGPQNISRVPLTLFEVSSTGGSSGTLRLEIYRRSQTQAAVMVTYIDSLNKAISYISGGSFTTQFAGGLSLTLQGRLIKPASSSESISCSTLTVSSFKQQ